MAFRITLARKDSKQQNVKATYSKLNSEAIAKLRKHQGKGDWENELVDKLVNTGGRDSDIMLVPVLKNAAGKYHEQAGKHKADAEKKEREAQQKRYAEKGGGQWKICRDLGKNVAAPLVAVKSPSMGPKGEAKGTVATAPREVDSIIRRVYGKNTTGIAKTKMKRRGTT